MHKIRIGVLRGGPSNEYDLSIKTGSNILNNLSKEKYNPIDIFIDKKGVWHVHGRPMKPFEALSHVDIVFNALHGNFGEDGKLQHLLENHNMKFTGSGSFASAIAMNKRLAKDIYERNNLKTPLYKKIDKNFEMDNVINSIFNSFSLPIVVKPVSSGSSIGISIVKDYRHLEQALKLAFEYSNEVIIEEYIKGKEAVCHIIDNFRDKEYYALPVVEIKSSVKGREFITPSFLAENEKAEIERMAILAHQSIGSRHYSESDFIIHPKRGVFIIETNTSPELTYESAFSSALESVGVQMSHFIDHIVNLAISRK